MMFLLTVIQDEPHKILTRETFADVDEARAFILTDAGDRNLIGGPEDPFCGEVLDFQDARYSQVETGGITYRLARVSNSRISR